MATTVIGSVAINPLLPITARGAGQASFGPVAIPAGFTDLSTMFDLQQVSSLTLAVTVSVQVSFDNGATWEAPISGGLDLAQSGYVLNGSVLTRSASDLSGPGPVRCGMVHTALTQCQLTTRQVRGTITASESAISGVTVSVI